MSYLMLNNNNCEDDILSYRKTALLECGLQKFYEM